MKRDILTIKKLLQLVGSCMYVCISYVIAVRSIHIAYLVALLLLVLACSKQAPLFLYFVYF